MRRDIEKRAHMDMYLDPKALTRRRRTPDDGDDDDQSEDEENCPTYGKPTPNNPYGRRIKPQLLSILPAGNIPKPTKPLNHQNLSPGTLIFSTVVVSFALDTARTTTAQGTCFFRLHDTADRVCGFIWDDIAPEPVSEQHAPSPSSLVREIFLLSQASPGAVSILVNTPEIGFADEYRHCTTRDEAVEAVEAAAPVGGCWNYSCRGYSSRLRIGFILRVLFTGPLRALYSDHLLGTTVLILSIYMRPVAR
jgi:hypothetical protein